MVPSNNGNIRNDNKNNSRNDDMAAHHLSIARMYGRSVAKNESLKELERNFNTSSRGRKNNRDKRRKRSESSKTEN